MIYDIAAAAVACMNATYSQTFSFVALVAPPTKCNLTRTTTKPTALAEQKPWTEEKNTFNHLRVYEMFSVCGEQRLGRRIWKTRIPLRAGECVQSKWQVISPLHEIDDDDTLLQYQNGYLYIFFRLFSHDLYCACVSFLHAFSFLEKRTPTAFYI